MSRSKKSRKQGSGSLGPVKDDKKKALVPVDRKPKKKNGKQAGNRQKEAYEANNKQAPKVENKDPRIGSKKPIDLGVPVKKAEQPFKAKNKAKIDTSPIAAIRVVEPDTSLEQELYAIEEDNRLQSILAKQDEDIALSDEDVDDLSTFVDKVIGTPELEEVRINRRLVESCKKIRVKLDALDE